VCGVFREREKKIFCNELVQQQQYVCGVFREREKKIFCNGTCVAAGKNLGELIEFNLVQQASCSRLEFFFFYFVF
jgi:hypothetical protein